jgi:hypothetical protein
MHGDTIKGDIPHTFTKFFILHTRINYVLSMILTAKTVIVSENIINLLTFTVATVSVYCAVGKDSR